MAERTKPTSKEEGIVFDLADKNLNFDEYYGYDIEKSIQAFASDTTKKKLGVLKRSDNKEADGFYHLRGFADAASRDEWMADPENNSEMVLVDMTLPDTSSGSTAVSYIVSLTLGSPKEVTATDKNVKSKVRFTSQQYNPVTQTTTDSEEDGTLTVQTRMEGATSWRTAATLLISSLPADSTEWTEIDLSPYLNSGTQTVRMVVRGNSSDVTSTYVSQTITVTALSMSFGIDTAKAYSAERYPSISVPIYVTGTVSKELHLAVTAEGYSKEYVIALGTAVYSETPYTATIQHPMIHGVAKVVGYLVSGSVQTEPVQCELLCPTSGGTSTLLALNDIASSLTNWSNVRPFSFSLYNPKATETTVTFALLNDAGTETYASTTHKAVPNEAKRTVQFALEVETDHTDDFNSRMTFTDGGGTALRARMLFKVDNSESFAPTANPDFVFNPKLHSNSDDNPQVVVNEATGQEVSSTWSRFFMTDDGYVSDADGIRCLRVLQGQRLTIDYEPFSDDTGAEGLTIEVDLATRNIVDDDDPVVNISTPLATDGNPVGLQIRCKEGFVGTMNKRAMRDQDFGFHREERTFITMNVVNNLYGRGTNFIRMFVNDTMNRELIYKDSDRFWQAVDGVKTCGGIVIGSDKADVDIYGIRIYKRNLSAENIVDDYRASLPSAEAKREHKRRNNIVGDSGAIDYEKAKLLYNCILVKGKLPYILDKDTTTVDLEITKPGDEAHSGTIKGMSDKGQGSTSKKYFKWNHQFGFGPDSVWVDGTGQVRGAFYQLSDDVPAATKLVAKINWASSMQSHKLGGTWAAHDLWKEVVGGSPITETAGYENCRIAVKQEPFLLFVQEREESDPVFYAPVTFGAGKGDKPTFGNKACKGYTMLEGSDNNPALTLGHVPWLSDEVTYNEEEEYFEYAGVGSYDLGAGDPDGDGVKRFAEFKNFIYLASTRLKPYYGTVESLVKDESMDKTYMYWVNKASSGAALYDLYRWDYLTSAWVRAGITKTASGSYSALNLKAQLTSYLSGFETSDAVVNEEWEQINELFRSARVKLFKASFSNYMALTDFLFHQCFIKLVAGTDNWAKNTYFYLCMTNIDKLIRMLIDDIDTIFPVNNQGQKEKPYYVEEHDKDASGKYYWNGENNALNALVEEGYADDLRTMMGSVLTAASKLGGGSLDGFYRKYFRSTQEYFPCVVYNQAAKLLYEEAALHYGIDYTNDTDPITQSLGSQKECEQQWWDDRAVYISSYACYGQFSREPGSGMINFRSTRAGKVTLELTPAVWLYPTATLGQTLMLYGRRCKAGETVTVDLYPDANTQVIATGINYMRDIGTWYDKPMNGAQSFIGKRLTVFRGGTMEDTGNIRSEITSASVGDMTSLRDLTFANIKTLTGAFDAGNLSKLETLDLRQTSVTGVTLPSSQYLKRVYLPATLTALRIDAQPSLEEVTLEGTDNLQTLYVNQRFAGAADTLAIATSLYTGGAQALYSVTLLNVDWTDTDAGLLDMLAAASDSELTGRISIYEPSLTKTAVTFERKLAYLAKWGDIDSASNKLYISYKQRALTVFSISGESYIRQAGTYQYKAVPSSANANDFNSISWSISSNPYATIDAKTGVLTATSISATAYTATITCTIGKASGESVTSTYRVGLYDRQPQVGDYVYHDATASDVLDKNKTCVGICVYVNPSNPAERYCVSLANVATAAWGLYNSTEEQFGMAGITLADSNRSAYDIAELANIGSSQASPVSDSTYRDEEGGDADGFRIFSGTCTENDGFFTTLTQGMIDTLSGYLDGKLRAGDRVLRALVNTAYIMRHRDLVLQDSNVNLPVPSAYTTAQGAVITETESLNDCIEAVKQEAIDRGETYSAKYAQYYYPAPSYAWAYEPKVGEGKVLADCFKAHRWALPASGDLERIVWYHLKGYDVETEHAIFAKPVEEGVLVKFSSSGFRSSTECNPTGAWLVNFGSGSVGSNGKYNSFVARAVAAF